MLNLCCRSFENILNYLNIYFHKKILKIGFLLAKKQDRHLQWRWLYMYSKVTFLWECLVTLTTLVWFLPTVCSYMLSKITLIWEGFVTLIALVWFLSSVFLVCIVSWSFHFHKKDLSHWMHWYGFSSLCVLVCLVRPPLSEKALPH